MLIELLIELVHAFHSSVCDFANIIFFPSENNLPAAAMTAMMTTTTFLKWMK